MEKDTKLALQVAKEIVVKFIEVGRISPSNFHTVFPSVYAVVVNTITDQEAGSGPGAGDLDPSEQAVSE